MKILRHISLMLALLLCCSWASCGEDDPVSTINPQPEQTPVKEQPTNDNENDNKPMNRQIKFTIDGETSFTATLADNSSAKALLEALKEAPITYEAHDYGNFEKVGELGRSFPRNDQSITTQPGDLILYQGSSLCIYYDKNQWTFTRLGKVDGLSQSELKKAVKAGQGNVKVTISLP